MTDPRHTPPLLRSPEEDVVAKLLRLAGPREPVPTDRASRVKAQVRADWHAMVRQRQRRRVWRAVGLGTGLAAAVLLALRVPGPGQNARVAVLEREYGSVQMTPAAVPPEPSASTGAGVAEIVQGTWIETDPHGRAALRLRGGSSLRIDVATRVRLASDSELLLARGAVYFDSAAHDQRVIVRTPLGTARDIGTQFEVRLGDGTLRIRVREGSVDLDASGTTGMAHEGEELELTSTGTLSRATVPVQGADWAWIQSIAPPFVLEGRSFRAFLDWYARETHQLVDISRLRGDRPEDVLLHGDARTLTPEEALEAVLPTCGLSQRRVGSVVFLEPLAGTARGRRTMSAGGAR